MQWVWENSRIIFISADCDCSAKIAQVCKMLQSFRKWVCLDCRFKGIKLSPISFWPSCKLHSCTACKFPMKAVIKDVNGPLLPLKDTWGCCCARALFTIWQHHTLSHPWWKQKLFVLRKCSHYLWYNWPPRQSMLGTLQFSCPPFINHAFVSWKTPGRLLEVRRWAFCSRLSCVFGTICFVSVNVASEEGHPRGFWVY